MLHNRRNNENNPGSFGFFDSDDLNIAIKGYFAGRLFPNLVKILSKIVIYTIVYFFFTMKVFGNTISESVGLFVILLAISFFVKLGIKVFSKKR